MTSTQMTRIITTINVGSIRPPIMFTWLPTLSTVMGMTPKPVVTGAYSAL